MKSSNLFIRKRIFLLAIFTTILFTACNNPASSEEEEHHHAEGAVLKMNGAEIVRVEDGEVQSGEIEVAEGEETPLITIYFLDEEGNEFQPDEPDFSLNWKEIDTAVAEIEKHDEDGKWSFHVHGVATGNTSVVLGIWHEEAEHFDFETPPITVTVN